MTYKALGKSALTVSRIGFGCMSLKGSGSDTIFLLQKAFDSGITFFDTADLYDKGENEKVVGKALKEKRDKVIIATKVGNQWRADGSGWDWNPAKAYIISAADQSLQRLQTDYIDLYQLHGGTIEDNIEETVDAFETLQKQGKIRYYGLSSIRPNVIRRFVQASNSTSVMMQYSLLDRRPEESCLPLLQKENIGVIARGSLAQGLLVNKPPKPYLNYSAAEVKKVAAAVQHAAILISPEPITVQYVLQHPAVTAAIIGIRTQDQLLQALKIPDSKPLSDNMLKMITSVLPVNTYTGHR